MAKTITIISGKGGTGKTSITASLAYLFKKSILVDADVDASDLSIVLPIVKTYYKEEFEGEKRAFIDKKGCISCHKCIDVCEFDSISSEYDINPYFCEGCGACFLVCPVDTIKWIQKKGGAIYHSETDYGPLFYAELYPGNGNAGEIVFNLRKRAENYLNQHKGEFSQILIDGPPGSGCPVISSITGVDMVIAITEPTLSGLSDLNKVIQVSKHFNVPAFAVINKYDINLKISKEIEDQLKEKQIKVISKIPYNKIFVQAEQQNKVVLNLDENKNIVYKEIYSIYNFIKDNLSL